MSAANQPAELLRRNSEGYEGLVGLIERLHPRRQANTVLAGVSAVAGLASLHHPGRFADGRVENLAVRIGRDLGRLPTSGGLGAVEVTGQLEQGRRRVLHVATAVRTTGGHTRTILNWARQDQDSHHTLLLTGQGPYPVPSWLAEAVLTGGGRLVLFPTKAPWVEKARGLRELASAEADLVVLHHFPDDVTPVVALAADGGPPVALLNHTDHHFWLGGTVADTVINLRGIGQRLSEERRFARSNCVLPIPLTDPLQGRTRAEARAAVGARDDQLLLLSVGRAEKYVPTATHNFYATGAKLLDRYPHAHLQLVGVSAGDVGAGVALHPRLHLAGEVEDPSAYQLAADVYLEGFPFGSSTALLESILSGVPAVPAFAPALDLIATNDDAVTDLLPTPADEAEYLAAASGLIEDAERRVSLGAELRRRLLTSHTNEGWLDRLQTIYRSATAMAHRARELPAAPCAFTPTDHSLCRWQEARRQAAAEQPLAELLRGLVFATAYRARQYGDYRGAWSLLSHSIRKWGGDRHSVMALAKLAPHWAYRRLVG